jgi:hypothetical protein
MAAFGKSAECRAAARIEIASAIAQPRAICRREFPQYSANKPFAKALSTTHTEYDTLLLGNKIAVNKRRPTLTNDLS